MRMDCKEKNNIIQILKIFKNIAFFRLMICTDPSVSD